MYGNWPLFTTFTTAKSCIMTSNSTSYFMSTFGAVNLIFMFQVKYTIHVNCILQRLRWLTPSLIQHRFHSFHIHIIIFDMMHFELQTLYIQRPNQHRLDSPTFLSHLILCRDCGLYLITILRYTHSKMNQAKSFTIISKSIEQKVFKSTIMHLCVCASVIEKRLLLPINQI